MTDAHHRRSIRLRGYDYAQAGAYFVTICTHGRAHLFGAVVDGAMRPSRLGVIAEAEWLQTAVVRPWVSLDAFVIMPNHMHGILIIHDDPHVGATRRVAPTPPNVDSAPRVAPTPPNVDSAPRVAPTPPNVDSAPRVTSATLQANTLGAIIGQFKSVVTKRARQMTDIDPECRIWQRSHYEHIIRHQADLDRIRGYIETNPARWEHDSLFSP